MGLLGGDRRAGVSICDRSGLRGQLSRAAKYGNQDESSGIQHLADLRASGLDALTQICTALCFPTMALLFQARMRFASSIITAVLSPEINRAH